MDGNEVNIDILYVEDDEVDIQGMIREFKKVNSLLKIQVAKNGVQALDKLYGRNGEEKVIPKVILLDINMPQMNGIEFLKELRSNPEFGSIEVYILTGAYTTSDKMALRDLHVAGSIVKPIEYSDALNVFWSLLHGSNNH
ncbi:two component response regulator (plasmid) [Legionella adelaidensis]|uniref:Two component response regulator n=1 Tax=Legionella adelaidensis TaxID=45056 RepID=A0A0W0R5D4_9GAMM|nr:response regulator [Legionella adelaidensis]KTC66242.1 two component response regulator [Legionella adelaidensis]VEH85757.1 two component response regulator [Legionella adelaidensis]